MPTPHHQTIFKFEPGKQDIFMTREFDAPRELVFKAYTDPAIYVLWLGPRGYGMRLDVFEPASGGRWRYVHTDPQGNTYGFHGVYHEVTAPERIISTFEYEGLDEGGHVMLETVRFEEQSHGRTMVLAHSVYQSVADRDQMIQSGMEFGLRESHSRLDEILERL